MTHTCVKIERRTNKILFSLFLAPTPFLGQKFHTSPHLFLEPILVDEYCLRRYEPNVPWENPWKNESFVDKKIFVFHLHESQKLTSLSFEAQ